MGYKIGILDQSPVIEGLSNHDILQRTVQLAQKAEKWGYERFWVSEHHNSQDVLGSAPEVLIPYLLAKTNTIRIGSGGVMLQHYSPYKVAEAFQVLATLEPGRVDLGVGKGPGGLPLSTRALQYGTVNAGKDFEERLTFLQQVLNGNIPADHPLAGIQAIPKPPKQQELILLGASPNSARLASKLGLTFSFARFFNSDDRSLIEAAKDYRENHKDGHFILAVSVIAAPTTEEAKQLAGIQQLVKIHLASGRVLTLQNEEAAEKFGKESGEEYEVKVHQANFIAGTPAEVKEELDRLHQQLNVDEFIIHTPVKDDKARIRSFELLSPLSLFKEKESITL